MITMGDVKEISYTDWLKCVKVSKEKGRHCNEFKILQCSFPVLSGDDYDNFVSTELAKLESQLIKMAIDDFQKSVNKSFEEIDLYIFEKGIREFKKSISDCVFFDSIAGYSMKIRNDMKENIRLNFMLFIDEFAKYIKKLMEYESNSYVNEMIYVYKKANVKTFIQERTTYE